MGVIIKNQFLKSKILEFENEGKDMNANSS